MTKSAIAPRRSVLANSLTQTAATPNRRGDKKGKGRAESASQSDDGTLHTTSMDSAQDDDTDSLKENHGREERAATEVTMDLVTSVSTGSLMHQAIQDAENQVRKPKRRKAAHRIPLHGEHDFEEV